MKSEAVSPRTSESPASTGAGDPALRQSSEPARRSTWAWALGTFFGAGLLKPGPGTWGSLAAAAIWYGCMRGAHLTGWAVAEFSVAGALAVTLIGIPAATIVEREFGKEDPGFVVIDEVAGQWLTLAAAAVEIRYVVLGFVLFRLFDIVKPPPARQLERLHGGTGIMLDDLAAGLYGLLVLVALRFFAGHAHAG